MQLNLQSFTNTRSLQWFKLKRLTTVINEYMKQLNSLHCWWECIFMQLWEIVG